MTFHIAHLINSELLSSSSPRVSEPMSRATKLFIQQILFTSQLVAEPGLLCRPIRNNDRWVRQGGEGGRRGDKDKKTTRFIFCTCWVFNLA